jgi:hypothetical protein
MSVVNLRGNNHGKNKKDASRARSVSKGNYPESAISAGFAESTRSGQEGERCTSKNQALIKRVVLFANILELFFSLSLLVLFILFYSRGEGWL